MCIRDSPIKQNRLLFLHYPDGRTVEPIVAHERQYFGAPGFENGRLQILMADFPAGKIYVFQYDPTSEQLTLRAELPRSAIKDLSLIHISVCASTHWMNGSLGTTIRLPIRREGKSFSCRSS